MPKCANLAHFLLHFCTKSPSSALWTDRFLDPDISKGTGWEFWAKLLRDPFCTIFWPFWAPFFDPFLTVLLIYPCFGEPSQLTTVLGCQKVVQKAVKMGPKMTIFSDFSTFLTDFMALRACFWPGLAECVIFTKMTKKRPFLAVLATFSLKLAGFWRFFYKITKNREIWHFSDKNGKIVTFWQNLIFDAAEA